MNTRIVHITQIAIIICCFLNNSFAQDKSYSYEYWLGKNSEVKNNIIFPEQVVSTYNLTLAKGSNGKSFFYKVAFDENDALKRGRIQASIFSSIDSAQLALVEYLECLTTIDKPPFLTDENFKAGDVAFGKIYNGLLKMAFVRNNVLIIIHAPTKIVQNITREIEKNIKDAPRWEKGTLNPSFILTK